ncbi:MAG: S24/S26 family peptidase [Bacteroidales bacterium]|nr:S24/S26 family peptidase [Bacteroidales bacterium]
MMDKVSDEQIIQEAVRLVNEGLAVTMLVKGRSMLPFILGGVESAVLTRPGTIKPGDVVLARIDGRRYVLHRVMDVAPDKVVLMGDGNIRGQEVCRPEDVLARTDEIVAADGKRRRLDTPKAQRRARLWRRLLPVRRWLLAFYKRTVIRNIPLQ